MVQDVVLDTVAPVRRATQSFSEEWDLDGLLTALQALYPTRLDQGASSRRRESAAELEELVAGGRAGRLRGEGAGRSASTRRRASRSCASSSAWCCCRSPTTSGASTCTRWTTCRRASGCARYGQKDPLVEFQREGYSMFETMKEAIRDEFVRTSTGSSWCARTSRRARGRSAWSTQHGDEAPARAAAQPSSAGDKIPRNAPCPCGSGRKYKKCHGRGLAIRMSEHTERIEDLRKRVDAAKEYL